MGEVDGDDDTLAVCTASPRNGEGREDGEEEGDIFDEKTFISGLILAHFRVNVSRRSVEDPGISAVLGGAQGLCSVGGLEASVPGPVAFAFDRDVRLVRVGTVILSVSRSHAF